jgi:hypothetical protein
MFDTETRSTATSFVLNTLTRTFTNVTLCFSTVYKIHGLHDAFQGVPLERVPCFVSLSVATLAII